MANFIQKAIKHPGRIKKMAKRMGISVPAAARKAAASSNKSLAGAGRLAERFEHGDLAKKRGKGLAGAISAARNK